jgi:excinuclease ABC subunit B
MSKVKFDLVTDFEPSGDQPKAIEEILERFNSGIKRQTLLGVTGSGKTFTMAHTIKNLGVPTLIMAPNKTLAAQLYVELKSFFPNNAVEYFVSYYDYYQPEAYVVSTDTFIEKDSAINEQIDRMRHSATHSLLQRKDVIIVSSVSCIYGLGSPDSYEGMSVDIELNQELGRDQFLRELLKIQYGRSDVDFHRGTFRVRGDTVDVHPAYEEDRALRIEFFGNFIEQISWIDPIRGKTLERVKVASIYPGSHYVTTEEHLKSMIGNVREELRERINHYEDLGQKDLRERIEKRTLYDLELMDELGFCPGIENYSRHLTGRGPGESPPTLLEYFPKDFLTILDESHVTVPQIGGMYKGDRARKTNLVEHAFRLPSALDNRPLNFEEFNKNVDKVVYVSATPGEYEFKASEGLITEQIIRPTGLVDPQIEVQPATNQVDHLVGQCKKTIEAGFRILVTTLTKRSSEDLTKYLASMGFKVKYLHSDIKTMERSDILRDLRLGVFDILIGINLLREGLDLPEVSLVAILDADKEGFLRSERSLVQTIGRAARNAEGRVILYADRITNSMERAMSETERRKKIQLAYNKEHGITPKTIIKDIKAGLTEAYVDTYGEDAEAGIFQLKERVEQYKSKKGGLAGEIDKLRKRMKKASEKLEFEEAAHLRDEIKRLQIMDLELS